MQYTTRPLTPEALARMKCYACGDEYTEPCARHAEVGRP